MSGGRVEPLAVTDSLYAYNDRLERLSRAEMLAGRFLATSMDTEHNSDGPAHEELAREFAEQVIAIRRELAAWREVNEWKGCG